MTTPHELAAPATQPVRTRRVVLPARTWTLVGAVLLSGFAAAHLIDPVLWLVTTVVAASILVGDADAIRRATSLAASGEEISALPPRLRRAVKATLDDLAEGDARRLLADVVRRARPLLAALELRPDDRRVLRDVSDLVEASCDIAADLARVDAVLCRPEDVPVAAGVEARCREMRELLVRRLGDAGAAIDGLYAQLLQEGTSASDRVAELASELTAEASARREAAGELERFLRRR